MARFIEDSDILTSEESIRKLTEASPNLAERIIEWFKYMRTMFKGTEYDKQLAQAERLYLKAVKEAQRNGAYSDVNTTDTGFSFKNDSKGNRYGEVDNGRESKYNKYGWAKENGLINDEEYANFFNKIGGIKRGEKYRRTADGMYMVPTGRNGVENTIIVTDGDYMNPSIESVIKINLDNDYMRVELECEHPILRTTECMEKKGFSRYTTEKICKCLRKFPPRTETRYRMAEKFTEIIQESKTEEEALKTIEALA